MYEEEVIYDGVSDLRSDEEKALDWPQEELVFTTASPVWQNKKKDDFKSYPSLNQFQTLKCVAFTLAKILMILYFNKTKKIQKFSPSFVYEFRFNKPTGGMSGNDVFEIWQKEGIPLEELCVSDHTQESQLVLIDDFARQVAKGFAGGNYLTITNGDFDRVAATIQQTGKGIMVWFYYTHKEWSREVPKVMDNLSGPYDQRASRHSVSAVDSGIITDIFEIKGQQVLKIEDSAHFGGHDVRYITREFFEKRNFGIWYPVNFKYEENKKQETDIEFTFTKTLRYDQTAQRVFGVPEVIKLQEVLQKLGFFPQGQNTSGWFGPITHSAVRNFQKHHNLIMDGIVGPQTRAKLNSLTKK